MKKRVVSLLLALVMLLGLLPGAALAAPEQPVSSASLNADAEGLPLSPSSDQPEVPAADGEADGSGQLMEVAPSSVHPVVTLAAAGNCRYHHGGDWNNGFGKDSDGPGRGSYDGGIVTATNSGSSTTIHLKERDHFKNADYLLQPFTLAVEVPAYTTYTVTFRMELNVNRNAKGATWWFVEMADNQNGAAYNKLFATRNVDTMAAGSKFRAHGDNKGCTWSAHLLTFVFDNSTGAATKSVALPYAMVVGNSKSGSALKSYHHQLETKVKLTTQKVMAAKYLTFDSNGGSAADPQSFYFTGEQTTLDAAPTRSGYTFDGWKDSISGRVYGAGSIYTEGRGAAMTAQWKRKAPTVTFDATGGTVSPASKQVTCGQTYGELPTPTKFGYDFQGWYTRSYSDGEKVTATTKVTQEQDHTLFAYWKRTPCKVTFMDGDQKLFEINKLVLNVILPFDVGIPTKPGYLLEGWSRSPGGERINIYVTSLMGDTTYYALWTPKSYTVTLDVNGGDDLSEDEATRRVTYDQPYGALPTPTRSGYTFTGWYTEQVGGGKVTENTKLTNANDHTLYAHWTRNAYTVTFDANGGGAVAPRKVNEGDALGDLPATARTGYTFGGWYTAHSGGTKITTATVPAGNVTYYAQWTAKQYAVTFDFNGAWLTSAIWTRPYGSVLTEGALPTGPRTGYTLEGWYTAKTGGEKIAPSTTVTGNATYYAHWTGNRYTVTYDANGGSVSPDSGEVTYAQTYGALPTPTRSGYAFTGWYTAPTGGVKVETTTKVQRTEDHTLYAQWSASQYTVTFDANGGSVSPASKSVTYGQPYGALPLPTRAEHTFAGWYTATGGGDLRDASSLVSAAKDHTLYAHWNSDHSHRPGASAATGELTFTAATAANLGTTHSGVSQYFLTGDLEIENSVTVSGQLFLCLNGHKLTYTGSGDSIFVVEDGGKLRICDCNGSQSSHTIVSPVTGESVAIQGGLITRSQAKTSVGTGVRVLGNGDFHLYSGAIAGISTVDNDGSHGAVRVEGTFHMYGGEICHNKIGCGAGVNICDIGDTYRSLFYLHGGSIHHNYASLDDGGGVCVNDHAEFMMSGGSIVDNKAVSGGGGIHSYGGNVTLLDSPTISGNTTENVAANYNIRLERASLIIAGALAPSAPIGVSITSPTPTADVPVAIGTVGSGIYAQHFTADEAGQQVIGKDGVLHLGVHAHGADGKDGAEVYTALTQDMVDSASGDVYTLTAGSYFLTGDITTGKKIAAASGAAVNLCLNGFTVTSTYKNGESSAVVAGSGSTLNVCDCKGGGGVTHTGGNVQSLLQANSGDVSLYGGTFTASTRGIIVNGGSLTIDGATVLAHGGVCVTNWTSSGTARITVNSGTVRTDTSGESGVYLGGSASAAATCAITGGTITGGPGGKGLNMGATNSAVDISGGVITGGDGSYGLYVETGAATLSGAPAITGPAGGIYIANANSVTAGGLADGAVYSVKYGGSIREGGSIAVTTADSKDNSGHFTAVDDGLAVRNTGAGDSQAVELYIPHSHLPCGGSETCAHSGNAHGEPVDYRPLTATEGFLSDGHYYLTEDITLTGVLMVRGDVSLCLNGHAISCSNSGEENKRLYVTGTLYLCDCKTGGAISNTTDEMIPVGLDRRGVLELYSGAVECTHGQAVNGSATLNLYGGTIKASGELNLEDTGSLLLAGSARVEADRIVGWGDPFGIVLDGTWQKPAAPYTVEVVPVQQEPHILTTGWAAMKNAKVEDYFTTPYVDGVQKGTVLEVNEDGELVLRPHRLTTEDGDILYLYNHGAIPAGTLPEPERTGYTFAGWYTAKTEGEEITSDSRIFEDITIYPRWTACEHEGALTRTEPDCVDPGQVVIDCADCGLQETTALPALGHEFTVLVNTDPGHHWYACAREGCGAVEVNTEGAEVKTAHTFGDWTVSKAPQVGVAGEQTRSCTVCAYAQTEALDPLPVPTYDVTYTVDDYTLGEAPTQEAVSEATSIDLPADGLKRTGYTLAGWALLDELGVPTLGEDGQEVVLSGAFAMPGRDVTFPVRWQRLDSYALQPGETLVLEDGTTITNDSGETVTIQQGGEGGATTVITLPGGTDSVTIQQGGDGEKDKVVVPPDSAVTTTPGNGEQGPVITIGSGNGTVDPNGKVEAPVGSTVTDKDGNTITVTEGSGGSIAADGTVTFPEGSEGKVTVTDKDGHSVEVTVPGGGDGLDVTPGGKPLVQGPDETITIVDPVTGSTTTITVPEPDPEDDGKPGNGAELDDDGNIILPGGSTVETEDSEGNKTSTTVPSEGGAVTPDGDVGTRRPDRELFRVTDIDPEHVTGAIAVLGDADKMEWRKVTDPESDWADVSADGSATATLDGLAEGSYQFRYKDDGGELGASLPREIRVNNNPEGGKALNIDENITNGTVSAVRTRVRPGFEVRLTVKPSAGYRLGSLSVTYEGGEPITPVYSTNTLTYNFTMPDADATVTATFVSTAPSHTHLWADVWSHDAGHHWHACTAPGCGVTANADKNGYGEHIYDNDQDKTCNTCGYTRTLNIVVTPENPVELPGGGSVSVDPDTGDVTIAPPKGEDSKPTTITPPESGGDVSVDPGSGEVTVPGGSTVKPGDGPEVTLPEAGGKVDPAGNITVPGGSTVTLPDGNGGQTEVTLPEGEDATIKPTEDGKVEVPAGATVTKPDGSTVTVPTGGGIVDPATGEMTPVKPDRPSRPGRPGGTVRPGSVDTPDVPDVPTVSVDRFTDVKPGDWFYDSVKTIVAQGLMNGTGETTFSPSLDTSRAMIATILWRLSGSPEPKAALPYPDCVADSWYAKAVAWASEQGVVKGYGSGNFGPDDPITREQLATMLWRYAQSKGQDVSVGEDTNILSYVDIDQAGEWAISALQWAAGSGVMQGKSGGVLDPVGKASRSEAATMLARYLSLPK